MSRIPYHRSSERDRYLAQVELLIDSLDGPSIRTFAPSLEWNQLGHHRQPSVMCWALFFAKSPPG